MKPGQAAFLVGAIGGVSALLYAMHLREAQARAAGVPLLVAFRHPFTSIGEIKVLSTQTQALGSVLPGKIIEVARRYEAAKIREVGGNNRGPAVEEILRRAGGAPGQPWCAATAWTIVDDACKALGIPNPLKRTASVHTLYKSSPAVCRTQTPAPGMVFCHDAGGGKGHAGIVIAVDSTGISTIEGNTNAAGSIEGNGIYAKHRDFGYVSLGYLNPAAAVVYA
jgi:hypothetical protein